MAWTRRDAAGRQGAAPESGARSRAIPDRPRGRGVVGGRWDAGRCVGHQAAQGPADHLAERDALAGRLPAEPVEDSGGEVDLEWLRAHVGRVGDIAIVVNIKVLNLAFGG